MRKFFYQNGLSLIFLLLFVITLAAQVATGFKEYNKELQEEGASPKSLSGYLISGYFIEATFENWERFLPIHTRGCTKRRNRRIKIVVEQNFPLSLIVEWQLLREIQ